MHSHGFIWPFGLGSFITGSLKLRELIRGNESYLPLLIAALCWLVRVWLKQIVSWNKKTSLMSVWTCCGIIWQLPSQYFMSSYGWHSAICLLPEGEMFLFEVTFYIRILYNKHKLFTVYYYNLQCLNDLVLYFHLVSSCHIFFALDQSFSCCDLSQSWLFWLRT